MNHNSILTLLAGFERRLASITDEAIESVTQAQRTVDRLNRLRDEVEQLRARFLASVDTSVHTPLADPSSKS